MGLLCLMAFRVCCLSSERVFFHLLGSKQRGLSTTLVAFGGGAALLWAAAWAFSQPMMIVGALLPSLIYTLHFILYVTAFSQGEVNSVSPWTNLSVLLLFLWSPTGGIWGWLGLAAFALAIWLMLERPARNWRPVLTVAAASALLAVGRILDLGQAHGPVLVYAANIYGWVSLWTLILILVKGQAGDVLRLISQRPQWSILSATSNAASYLTLVWLIHRLPLSALEALSSLSALIAALVGSFWLLEPVSRRKMMASWLMSAGAVALLWDHLGGNGFQD